MRFPKVLMPMMLAATALAVLGPASSATPTKSATPGLERLDYFDLKTTPESYDLPTLSVKSVAGDVPTINDQTRWALEQQAKESGVPFETLIAEWDGHEIGAVTDQIAAAYPDIFVKTVVAPDDSGVDYDIVFTRPPPDAVFALLSTVPRRLQVRYGAPLSMTDSVAGERLTHSLLVAQFGTEFLTSFSDSRLGTTVSLDYATPDADTPIGVEEVAEFVSQSLARFTLTGEAPVVIASRYDELTGARDFVAMQGGMKLNTIDSGTTYMCTSGFGAKRNSNGNRGLVTASHCKDTGGGMQYESSTGALGSPVHVGPSDVDVQFNKAEGLNTVTNKFKATSTATYQVTAASNPVEGDEVSKYGRATGWSEGVVVDPQTCNTQNTWCSMFKVDNMNGDGGDSGGPCFRGYGARGLVQGGIPGDYTYCTRISTLANDGFTILTQ